MYTEPNPPQSVHSFSSFDNPQRDGATSFGISEKKSSIYIESKLYLFIFAARLIDNPYLLFHFCQFIPQFVLYQSSSQSPLLI